MPTRRPTSSPNLKLPEVTEAKLASGLRALMVDIPNCPAIRFELNFRAGDYLCPDDKPDLAHFLEHMVLGANAEYSTKADFARALGAKGGIRNAYTNSYNLSYWLEAPDFDFERMLDLMLLAVSQPSLLAEEFASEREVIRQEFVRRVSNRPVVVLDMIRDATGFVGTRDSERLKRIDAVRPEDLWDYYRQTHTLDNARVVVAGHLPSSRRRYLQQCLDRLALPSGSVGRPALPSEKLRGAGLVYDHDSKSEAVHYLLAFADGRRQLTRLQEDALLVLNILLFGGAHSRILGQARQRGLIYAIGGDFYSTVTSGFYYFAGQVSADNLEPLVDLIRAEVNRLLDGDLPESEVDRIKVEIQGDFYRSLITPGGWVNYYKGQYFWDDTIESTDLGRRLGSVTREEVLLAARQVLLPNQWTMGLLGQLPSPSRKRLTAKLDRGWGAKP